MWFILWYGGLIFWNSGTVTLQGHTHCRADCERWTLCWIVGWTSLLALSCSAGFVWTHTRDLRVHARNAYAVTPTHFLPIIAHVLPFSSPYHHIYLPPSLQHHTTRTFCLYHALRTDAGANHPHGTFPPRATHGTRRELPTTTGRSISGAWRYIVYFRSPLAFRRVTMLHFSLPRRNYTTVSRSSLGPVPLDGTYRYLDSSRYGTLMPHRFAYLPRDGRNTYTLTPHFPPRVAPHHYTLAPCHRYHYPTTTTPACHTHPFYHHTPSPTTYLHTWTTPHLPTPFTLPPALCHTPPATTQCLQPPGFVLTALPTCPPHTPYLGRPCWSFCWVLHFLSCLWAVFLCLVDFGTRSPRVYRWILRFVTRVGLYAPYEPVLGAFAHTPWMNPPPLPSPLGSPFYRAVRGCA